ncbi:MAG: right-handed parallel beta-helix repeat-containing protein [Planctomycetaceae bacterium]
MLVIVATSCLDPLTRQIDAGVIYVDSRLGNDAADGTVASPLNQYSGPVRTLQCAARRLCPGDVLVLANNGDPYYGSLSFVGPRHSGVPGLPMQLIGNGATISGARPIPPAAWRAVDLDVWSVTPLRKTYAQVSRAGQTLPTYELPWPLHQLPNAPADRWYLEEGRILFKTKPVDDPRLSPMELASEEVGLTLLGVEHIVIRDVTFRHFRLDGINAHDRCRDVVLDNVVCEENGRAGIAVGGTSRVVIHNCLLTENRRNSLLITELGQADVQESELSPEPTVLE